MSTLTKVFIVLQLVFSIGLTVMVVMTLGDQARFKSQVEAERAGRLGATANSLRLQNDVAAAQELANKSKADRDTQVAALQSAKDNAVNELQRKKGELDALTAQVTEATSAVNGLKDTIKAAQQQIMAKDEELKSLRPVVADLTKKNSELERKNNELVTAQDASVKAINTLKEACATLQQAQQKSAAAAEGPQVANLSTGTPTAVQINGKVEKTQDVNGRTYVTLSLGSRDGVAQGTRFTIYRGNDYVGDVVVQRAVPDQAVGIVTETKKPVQAGDLVISGNGM